MVRGITGEEADMDISSLTHAAAKLAEAAEAAAPAQTASGVPLPDAPADPEAVAQFRDAMQGPQGAEFHSAAPEGVDKSQLAGGAGVDAVAEGGGLQAYATMMQVLSKDALSHADLYRVQVMAGMASIEAQRNASAVSAMDRGLKTMLKDSG